MTSLLNLTYYNIYKIYIVLVTCILPDAFIIKSNETGRYSWETEQGLEYFCAYCNQDILRDPMKYKLNKIQKCIDNNRDRSDLEKANGQFPYCHHDVGTIPNCGSLPVVELGHWECDKFISSKQVLVYTSCILKCNNTEGLQHNRPIRCNESLIWDEEVDSYSCMKKEYIEKTQTTSTQLTTVQVFNTPLTIVPAVNVSKGCEHPANISSGYWICNISFEYGLLQLGTSCTLSCDSSGGLNNNVTITCMGKDLSSDWSPNVSQFSCKDVKKEDNTYMIVAFVLGPCFIIIVLVVCCMLRRRKMKARKTAKCSKGISTTEENKKFLRENSEKQIHSDNDQKDGNNENQSDEDLCSTGSSQLPTSESGNSSVLIDIEAIAMGTIAEPNNSNEVGFEVLQGKSTGHNPQSQEESVVHDPQSFSLMQSRTDADGSSYVSDKQPVVALPNKQASNGTSFNSVDSLDGHKLYDCPLPTLSDPITTKDNQICLQPQSQFFDQPQSKRLEEFESKWEKESLTDGLNNINTYDKKEQHDKLIPGETETEEFKPHILKRNSFELLDIKTGKEFQIQITASGQPVPKFTWEIRTVDNKRNSVIASDISCSEMEPDKVIQTFKCLNPTVNDLGEYTVTAYNKHGSDTAIVVAFDSDLCSKCKMTMEKISETRANGFVTQLGYRLEPLDCITEQQSWKGLAKWIGVDHFFLENTQWHRRGNPNDGPTKFILDENLKHAGCTLGHINFYFSLPESRHVDVLRLVQSCFTEHCNTCEVCSMILKGQDEILKTEESVILKK